MENPGSLTRNLQRALLAIGGFAAAAAPCAQAQGLMPASPSGDTPAQALTCMTQAIAYEAGFEPLNGKQAVAEVILNRTHNPRFPTSVCGVVYQGAERSTGCQFTFTCDGSLRRRLPDWVMDQARDVASGALNNRMPLHVGGAINYHADYVYPRWAATMVRVTQIGRHIFYRAPGRSLAGGMIETTAPDLPDETLAAGAAPSSSARPVQTFSLWGLAAAHGPAPAIP